MTAAGKRGATADTSGLFDMAREILNAQYRVVCDTREGALEAKSPEPLHDMRVAFRRLRAAIRFFRRPLGGALPGELEPGIRALNRKLGQARDADVWLGFLESPALVRAAAGDARWLAYLEAQRRGLADDHDRVRAVLNSEAYDAVMRQLESLLDAECPAGPEHRGETVRSFTARRLRKAYRRLCNRKGPVRGHSHETLHDLRRLCRRLRYWAEFCTPLLGSPVEDLAARAKAAANALGDYRDADLAIQRLGAEPVAPPPAVLRKLKKRRAKSWAAAKRAWSQLTRKQFRRQVQQSLSRVVKGNA